MLGLRFRIEFGGRESERRSEDGVDFSDALVRVSRIEDDDEIPWLGFRDHDQNDDDSRRNSLARVSITIRTTTILQLEE